MSAADYTEPLLTVAVLGFMKPAESGMAYEHGDYDNSPAVE